MPSPKPRAKQKNMKCFPLFSFWSRIRSRIRSTDSQHWLAGNTAVFLVPFRVRSGCVGGDGSGPWRCSRSRCRGTRSSGAGTAGAPVHQIMYQVPYRYQRMYQVSVSKNVPGTGTKECTRYRYQRMYQVPVPKNVPGTGAKECTRYRCQKMYYLVPVPKNVPGTGTKECTGYRHQRMYQLPAPKNVPATGTGTKECTGA